MNFLGVVVNVLAIVVASGIGAIFRGKIRTQYQQIIVQTCGLAAIVFGAFGIFDSLFVFAEKDLEITGWILIVFALVTGTIFGEAFGITADLEKIGAKISVKVKKEEEFERVKQKKMLAKRRSSPASSAGKHKTPIALMPTYNMDPMRFDDLFAEGFVVATMLVGFGYMAVQGSATGNTTTLYIKSAVDALLVAALATVYGASVSYSAIAVIVIEGLLALSATIFGSFFTVIITGQLAVIFSVIMLVVGINMAFGKKIKVENMIPAALIPIVYYLITNIAVWVAGE